MEWNFCLIDNFSKLTGIKMNLFFNENGQSSSETIIFIHGLGISGWMWNEQLEFFHDYHCIIPDLPEHGKSRALNHFTIDDAAESIVELINEHAHNQLVHLVGISLGAQVVLQILSKAPELVNSAFISGALISTNSNNATLLKSLYHTLEVYQPVKNSDFFIKANMRTYNMPKRFYKEFKKSTASIENKNLEEILRENITFKLPIGLENLEVPLLVMVGEKDYKIIKKSALAIIEKLPESESAMACNVGHLWNLESPKLFNSVLYSWLTERKLPVNGISSIKI
jgi:pimeloyl-ACP methyl ester carboxylesterase